MRKVIDSDPLSRKCRFLLFLTVFSRESGPKVDRIFTLFLERPWKCGSDNKLAGRTINPVSDLYNRSDSLFCGSEELGGTLRSSNPDDHFHLSPDIPLRATACHLCKLVEVGLVSRP